MKEIWKDICFIENGIIYDYKGLYQVSNLGRIKSLYYQGANREKILKCGKSKDNYLYINLWKNKKSKYFLVHRLVAYMFIENDDKEHKKEINHKDENHENNNIDNLEWCNRDYNINYGNRNKKASMSMKKITIERYDKNGNLLDIKYQCEYVKMGFRATGISQCCNKKIKTHKGFIFKYHKSI